MEKKKYSETCKWVLFYTICTIGFIAFMVLAGEEDPCNPMPLGTFFLYKIGALAVLAMCFFAGKKLHTAGMFPKKLDENLEEDEL